MNDFGSSPEPESPDAEQRAVLPPPTTLYFNKPAVTRLIEVLREKRLDLMAEHVEEQSPYTATPERWAENGRVYRVAESPDTNGRAAKRGRDEALDDFYAALDYACAVSVPDTSAKQLALILRESVGRIRNSYREQGGDL